MARGPWRYQGASTPATLSDLFQEEVPKYLKTNDSKTHQPKEMFAFRAASQSSSPMMTRRRANTHRKETEKRKVSDTEVTEGSINVGKSRNNQASVSTVRQQKASASMGGSQSKPHTQSSEEESEEEQEEGREKMMLRKRRKRYNFKSSVFGDDDNSDDEDYVGDSDSGNDSDGDYGGRGKRNRGRGERFRNRGVSLQSGDEGNSSNEVRLNSVCSEEVITSTSGSEVNLAPTGSEALLIHNGDERQLASNSEQSLSWADMKDATSRLINEARCKRFLWELPSQKNLMLLYDKQWRRATRTAKLEGNLPGRHLWEVVRNQFREDVKDLKMRSSQSERFFPSCPHFFELYFLADKDVKSLIVNLRNRIMEKEKSETASDSTAAGEAENSGKRQKAVNTIKAIYDRYWSDKQANKKLSRKHKQGEGTKQTRELIKLVKARPVLWQPDARRSTNTRLLLEEDKAWAELAGLLDWPEDMVKECWYRLQDNIKKQLENRMMEDNPKTPTWPFYQDLLFLKDALFSDDPMYCGEARAAFYTTPKAERVKEEEEMEVKDEPVELPGRTAVVASDCVDLDDCVAQNNIEAQEDKDGSDLTAIDEIQITVDVGIL